MTKMNQIDFYATAEEIAEQARGYTVEDVKQVRGYGTGWYTLPDGYRVGFDFLVAIVEQWIEREHGGIYIRTENTYASPVVHLGTAPSISRSEQRYGPYGGWFPEVEQVPRDQWILVTHSLTAGMVPEVDDDGALGYGEDCGDDVRENAEMWGLR